ncbi:MULTISPECIES: hypothetical protein [unclassified Janthinobacterium]|nr:MULTISPECIES: hypothetical protein [unclassified Janthinobacterium]MBB5609486.1 hypothetical protein [Janthinobacterium sp. S3T4]MBB5614667.1 hypothetical protein [Janthinobacterium sp. S3M3]
MEIFAVVGGVAIGHGGIVTPAQRKTVCTMKNGGPQAAVFV